MNIKNVIVMVVSPKKKNRENKQTNKKAASEMRGGGGGTRERNPNAEDQSHGKLCFYCDQLQMISKDDLIRSWGDLTFAPLGM